MCKFLEEIHFLTSSEYQIPAHFAAVLATFRAHY